MQERTLEEIAAQSGLDYYIAADFVLDFIKKGIYHIYES